MMVRTVINYLWSNRLDSAGMDTIFQSLNNVDEVAGSTYEKNKNYHAVAHGLKLAAISIQ